MFGRPAALSNMATVTSTSHGSQASMPIVDSSAPTSYTYNSSSPRTATFPESESETGPRAALPNPPFVFPARPASSAPTSFSRATGRRTQPTNEPKMGGMNMDFKIGASRPGPPPLPSFSFNQAPRSDPEPGNSSPQLSPTSPRFSLPLPARPHRRGHSEFIGVDANPSAGQLLSTGLNSDNPLPPPGPPKGRRGHAHRRSAAISCGDLTFIIKPAQPPPKPAGGSVPASPVEEKKTKPSFTFEDITTVSPVPEVVTPPIEEIAAPRSPPKPQRTTARVGFSDTLEYIPRPLSLVSSDASSTMTVRQGHSVTNSMSSVISLSASSSPSETHRGLATASRSTNADEDRPSTAGPILSATRYVPPLRGQDDETRRRNSDPATVEEASTAAKIAANGLQEYTLLSDDYNMSPDNSRPTTPSSFDRAQIAANFMAPTPGIRHIDTSMSGIEELPKLARKTSSTRKVKKQKKVKYWAGSILSRKNKSRKVKASKRTPTPPMQSFEEECVESPVTSPVMSQRVVDSSPAPEIDLDAALAETPLTKSQADFLNWKPRHIASSDEESSSPIIDLDAALGPFNTPSHDSDWAAAQKAGSPATRRKMHSAAGMRNFTGPGLHYHRRTESAPEMVAFESPRFGNSSTMEDVFEEDEEDDWEEVKTVSHKGSSIQNDDDEVKGLGIEIKVVDAENGQGKMDWASDEQRGIKRKTSALSEQESQPAPTASQVSIRSQGSLKDTVKAEDFEPPPPIRDDCSIYRPNSSRSSTSSTIQTEKFPTVEQSYPPQPPYLTPTTPSSTFQSPFPSPRSRMSHETQRQSTAPSSIVEEPGFNPLWLGEPGPEIRMSVDDVPSLTSSNSTMTRDSMAAQNPALGNPQFRQGQRSASLSSGGLGPASKAKRGSIVSLSRLLSSSHGEKSKLSIEERAPELDERKKVGKGKRISRMMQFWKPSKD